MPSFELLLPLGALAFYAYDCGMLLYDDELLLLQSGRQWRVEAGSQQFLFRRRACLPGFFQPWVAIYRAGWRELPVAGDAAGELPMPPMPPMPGLLVLRVLCTLMLLAMLPVLPLVSLAWGAGWAMLGVFAAYYLLALVALGWLWRRRHEWRLSNRACAGIAFDALACAPFAANLLRRVTLPQALPGDGMAHARVLCAPAMFQSLEAELRARRAPTEEVAP